ncbi:hypothetical protein ACM75Z_30550 [Pseudomonas aeruginosa]
MALVVSAGVALGAVLTALALLATIDAAWAGIEALSRRRRRLELERRRRSRVVRKIYRECSERRRATEHNRRATDRI